MHCGMDLSKEITDLTVLLLELLVEENLSHRPWQAQDSDFQWIIFW